MTISFDVDFHKIVDDLREPNKYKELCINTDNLLYKCILCKKYLSSNEYSILLEKFIIKKFNLKKNIDNLSGDALSENNLTIEIKISLGDKTGKFNFVQLRPDHNIDYYLFLAYNLYDKDDTGKIYWLFCKSTELYELIPEYGGYAHGTIKKLGRINNNNMYGRNCEYCLRPNPTKNDNTKVKKLWNIMVDKFLITEEELIDKLKNNSESDSQLV
jgi:hypothetical protein